MLRVNLDLCSGCRRCMLACSFYRMGGFNPRLSSLQIETDAGNRPIAYHLGTCSDCREAYCAHFCIQGAIEVGS